MASNIAIVRQRVMSLPGVTGTWIEWVSNGDPYKMVLVVEVDWDTDPNSTGFHQGGLEDIDKEIAHVLSNNTTMVMGSVRIVPKDRP